MRPAKKTRKANKQQDQMLALRIFGRNEQFERNGGGQWVAVNRPHRNKKKYDRKQIRKEDRKNLPFSIFICRLKILY